MVVPSLLYHMHIEELLLRVWENKLNEAKTNLLVVGIMIERPENKSNHSKDVILIKRDVSTGEPGNSGTFLYLRKKKMIMKEHLFP